MARGDTLTINGLQLGGAGVGFHAKVLDPACVALVDIHKINGLPLGITWVTHFSIFPTELVLDNGFPSTLCGNRY